MRGPDGGGALSVPDINSLSEELLVALAMRNATNGNPGHVREICAELRPDMDWSSHPQLASSAGWLLVRNSPPFAKKVMDTDRPGAMLLALTAAGKSQASRLYNAQQPLSLWQKLTMVPRSDWIAFWALVVSVGALIVSAIYVYFTVRPH